MNNWPTPPQSLDNGSCGMNPVPFKEQIPPRGFATMQDFHAEMRAASKRRDDCIRLTGKFPEALSAEERQRVEAEARKEVSKPRIMPVRTAAGVGKYSGLSEAQLIIENYDKQRKLIQTERRENGAYDRAMGIPSKFEATFVIVIALAIVLAIFAVLFLNL